MKDMLLQVEPLIPALRRYARALVRNRANADDLIVVKHDRVGVVFSQEVHEVANHPGFRGELVVGVWIHENEVIGVAVEELQINRHNRVVLDRFAGLEGKVDNSSGPH